jgi:hypothetical protein
MKACASVVPWLSKAIDIIGFTQGRTELTLTTTMALASAATVAQNELVLAKSLVSRVRA